MYAFLAARFAAQVGDMTVAQIFRISPNLLASTVDVVKHSIAWFFTDNCIDASSTAACKEMIRDCDKPRYDMFFGLLEGHLEWMCNWWKWTGVQRLITALDKNAENADGSVCVSTSAKAVSLFKKASADPGGNDDGALEGSHFTRFWTAAASLVKGAATVYYGLFFTIVATALREEQCAMLRGLLEARQALGGGGGGAVAVSGGPTAATAEVTERDFFWCRAFQATLTRDTAVLVIPPRQPPDALPAETAKRKEEKRGRAAKPAAPFTPTDESCARDASDSELRKCFHGLHKLFMMIAIRSGADAITAAVQTDDNMDVLQAVQGLAGVRHMWTFLSASVLGGEDFNPGRVQACLQIIKVCGSKRVQDAEKTEVKAKKDELKYIEGTVKLLSHKDGLLKVVCEKRGAWYMRRIFKVLTCARREKAIVDDKKCQEMMGETTISTFWVALLNGDSDKIKGYVEGLLVQDTKVLNPLVGVMAAFIAHRLVQSYEHLDEYHRIKDWSAQAIRDELEAAEAERMAKMYTVE